MVRYSSMARKALLNWKPVAFRRFIRTGLTLFGSEEESETDNFQFIE